MNKIGIYDIRGKYPYEFDERTAAIAADFFLSTLARGKKRPFVIVGHDVRASSLKILKSIIPAIKKRGAEFTNIGLCTTPMIYFLARRMGADLGLMVTASHNPPEYNGLKIVSFPPRTAKSSKLKPIDIYSGFFSDFADVKHDIKVVLDCSNGMAGLVLEKLLPKMKGLEYKIINARPDGKFPAHGPNPLKTSATRELSRAVLLEKADLGIIFDGDGDRAFFVDEKGKRIDTEIISTLIAEHLRAKTVVVDSSVGWVFKRNMSKCVQKVVISPVGHDHIPRVMDEEGATFAFERSGHFYFKVSSGTSKFNFDSGILAAIFAINSVSGFLSHGKTLSEFAENFSGRYFRHHRDFTVKEPYKIIDKIKKHFGRGKRFSQDGLSIEYKGWWFNVRPSSTEPLLRLSVEADSEKLLKAKFNKIISIIRH